jgi:group I intron endonuclease
VLVDILICMAYGIVYRIFNVENGKSYVGQTVRSLEERWKEHLSYVAGSKRPLYRAMRKHGVGSFVLTKLCDAFSQKELDDAELYFGELFHALAPDGYCLKLGEGKGRHCEETKLKIREKRRQQNERNGTSSPRYGTGNVCVGTCPCGKTFRSYEGRKYCSQKCRTEQDHDLLAKRFVNQYSMAGAIARSKRIKDLQTGIVYPSARAASRALDIPWGSFLGFMHITGRLVYVKEEE